MSLYDKIGTDYDTTRHADPCIAGRLMHHLNIRDNRRYLDLACGTGNYTVAIASRTGAAITGIDQSSQMIDTASQKEDSIEWHVGDAESLPFDDNAFSGIICTLAIHHFKSLLPVFREAFRVLDRGNLVIFTADPEQMKRYWLNEYFPEAINLSLIQMPSIDRVIDGLNASCFKNIETEPFFISNNLKDFFLYSGKHKPKMYLDPDVRKGISTFANLANSDEVSMGCKRLSEDIRSGKIDEVIRSYDTGMGDYLFVVAEKV